MIRVTLFSRQSGEPAGRIEFKTLLVRRVEDYQLDPAGVLTLEEVQQLAAELRRLPQVNWGLLSDYSWKVV